MQCQNFIDCEFGMGYTLLSTGVVSTASVSSQVGVTLAAVAKVEHPTSKMTAAVEMSPSLREDYTPTSRIIVQHVSALPGPQIAGFPRCTG